MEMLQDSYINLTDSVSGSVGDLMFSMNKDCLRFICEHAIGGCDELWVEETGDSVITCGGETIK